MNFWHAMDSLFYINKETKRRLQKVFRFVFFAVLILFIALAIYFGYKQIIMRRETAAQQSFAHVMTLFSSVSAETTPDKRENMIKEIKEAKEKHKNSVLAPYFSHILSQIYAKEHNNQEALIMLEDGINNAKDILTRDLMQTNYALLLLDSKDEESNKKGIEILRNLIDDANNPVKDMAQFYLGKYFWTKNDIEMAKIVWTKFLDEQEEQRLSPSPFVQEVKLALSSLI